jgi:tetratricopeptide (TPR) repeat protein
VLLEPSLSSRSLSARPSRRSRTRDPPRSRRWISESRSPRTGAWNNLGIGYEHEGRFDDARKAYEKAVALDPKNILIRQNYDLFKEINDRAKRRNDR